MADACRGADGPPPMDAPPGPTRTPILANASTGVVTSTPSALSTAARFHNFFLEFKKLLSSVTASHAIQLQ
eukprot:5959322-Pleurochrysis_carterae.AAC.1